MAGRVAYQTAYLKHHYPYEFMAASMSCDQTNSFNIVKFITEARSTGITVEPPSINQSAADLTVVVRPDTGDELAERRRVTQRNA